MPHSDILESLFTYQKVEKSDEKAPAARSLLEDLLSQSHELQLHCCESRWRNFPKGA